MTFLPAALALAALMTDPPVPLHIKAAQSAYDEGKTAGAEHRPEKAVECFRKAIGIEPTFIEAREALIDAYMHSAQSLNAAAAVTELLEIKPEALNDRILLGQILLQQKENEKALAQFSLVLKEDSANAEGLLGFAAAARHLGMNDRADRALERGRKLYPSDRRFKTQTGAPRQQ